MSSKLDGVFESAPMQKFLALGTALQEKPAFSAISSGMMGTMGLILCGAVFTIVSTLLNLAGILSTEDALYQWLQLPYNMTMGCMAVAVAFGVAYTYTNNLKMKGAVANGFVAMFLFLMVCSPVKSVELADGTTSSVMDTTYLGGTGLFTALILPIACVRIIKLCQDKHIAIQMPDVVPQFLSDSFSSLIPLVINVVLWSGLNTLCENFMGAAIPGLILGILSIPLGALVSVPGMVVLVLVAQLFWCFGIHGSAIVYIVIMAPMMAAMQENAALVAAGEDPLFNATFLFNALGAAGGAGNVLSLAVLCLRSKSEQLKAVGKAGVIPAVFNISEPMVFGVPIMYNPIIVVPCLLNAAINTVVFALLYGIGFFQPSYIMIMTALPIGVGEFLNSMAWQNVLMPVVAFVVSYLCYAPFVRVYDKQLCESEAAEAAEAAAA